MKQKEQSESGCIFYFSDERIIGTLYKANKWKIKWVTLKNESYKP